MRKGITILLSMMIVASAFSQKDWSKVDFADNYKRKVKLSSGFSKELKSGKTFIANYQLHQATVMKGSETTATSGVHAEISLNGIEVEAYQNLADEMYQELVSQLKSLGANIVTGDELLQSPYVQKKTGKVKEDDIIGNSGENPSYPGKKKITDGSIMGYGAWAVTRDLNFPVRNINYLFKNNILGGSFLYKTAMKEKVNLMSVDFYISFASFDGGRGYKDISIEVNPVIAVNMVVQLYGPKGGKNFVEYKKLPVWGGTDWSMGVEKTKENDGSFWGLSSSADFQVTANAEKYMEEVSSIIQNLQKDMVQGIKEEL